MQRGELMLPSSLMPKAVKVGNHSLPSEHFYQDLRVPLEDKTQVALMYIRDLVDVVFVPMPAEGDQDA